MWQYISSSIGLIDLGLRIQPQFKYLQQKLGLINKVFLKNVSKICKYIDDDESSEHILGTAN